MFALYLCDGPVFSSEGRRSIFDVAVTLCTTQVAYQTGPYFILKSLGLFLCRDIFYVLLEKLR